MSERTKSTQLRSEKLSIQIDPGLLDNLRAKQAELAREFGVQVSLSQAAAAALRRGLEGPART